MSRSRLEPEQEIHSVVILGSFNPAIFHPSWFSENELIAKEETEEAEDLILNQEVSTFVVSDIHVQVEQHRFGLTTKDPAKAPMLKDLAAGSFVLLEHTPLNALGLNLDLLFSLSTTDAWNEVGDRLAPKESWQGILESPGMRRIVMEGKRNDSTADRISIQVQPSPTVERSILIGTNQHYVIKTKERATVGECNAEVIRILNDDWQAFRNYARHGAESLILGRSEPKSTNL